MWEKLKTRTEYTNNYMKLTIDTVRLPNGQTHDYTIVNVNNFVCIVPVTKDNQILLIRQFRYPWQKTIWEIPGGLIDGKEVPETAAARELKEETGYAAKKLTRLLDFYASGILSNHGTIFCAELGEKDTFIEDNREPEILKSQIFDKDTIQTMITKNEIIDASSLVGLMFYLQNQNHE